MTFTKLDQKLRMSESETHVFFVGGPFSQWHRAQFEARLQDAGDVFKRPMLFNTAEQYMMASKASMFRDFDTLVQIMQTPDPKEQKALGRQVVGFDVGQWEARARDIVYEGNMAKFTQNADLFHLLLETENKYLVEGADYDRVWGVGLAWNNPAILDPANWQGKNWLGETLMRVRDSLTLKKGLA